MIQKKQKLYLCFMALGAFLISNCGAEVNSVPSPITSATTSMESSTPVETNTPTITPTSTLTFTPSPVPIVLPAVTMSPQEAEDALQELLKTNGNCTGKCLAGIRPDEMTAQEAVNQMAKWGMLRMSENEQGKTFINNLYLNPNSKQVNLNLTIALRRNFETTYRVSFYIPRPQDGEFLGSDVWLANHEAWRAFRFDNLLKAYGIPSFVGFSLQTDNGSIVYGLEIQYEQINLDIGIGEIAHQNGQDIVICPSNDPHNLGIEINPERSLKEIQPNYPITWQLLTDSDLQAFYQTFVNETNSHGCVIATLEKIMELDPTFR